MPALFERTSETRRGALAAFSAYFFWGIVPLYWKLLGDVSAVELIAHRLLWSLVFLLLVQVIRRRLDLLKAALVDRSARGPHLWSGFLLTANWLIYIWGIQQGHVIECSLGYFLVPLLNAALGRVVLKERLRLWQVIALALATLGVAVLVIQVGRVPWIALGLAASFGFYGLIRKQATLGPMTGLALETLFMTPLALGYLVWATWSGPGALGRVDTSTTLLVLSTGVVTTIPLLLFAYGARRLRFTTLGLLQYVAPTAQFLLGWLVYHEPFTADRAAAFALIWLGLVCYTVDAWRQATSVRRPG